MQSVSSKRAWYWPMQALESHLSGSDCHSVSTACGAAIWSLWPKVNLVASLVVLVVVFCRLFGSHGGLIPGKHRQQASSRVLGTGFRPLLLSHDSQGHVIGKVWLSQGGQGLEHLQEPVLNH